MKSVCYKIWDTEHENGYEKSRLATIFKKS
jgi:hypothetical protein